MHKASCSHCLQKSDARSMSTNGSRRTRWWRMKGTLRIPKHYALPLQEHDHIRLMSMPTVHKLQRHRNPISALPIEMRPEIDLRVRAIPCGKVDDFDLPFEIEREKMARMSRAVALPNHGIHLEGAWVSILQGVPGVPHPADEELTQQDHRHRDHHSDSDPHHRDVLPFG